MSRKAFQVKVELDIQGVSCPGVWLCSNGSISLQIYMLGSCVQTASYKPSFPILCREKFAFYKTFVSKHQLKELQKELGCQWLYVELVQWQSGKGTVLAIFQTTLDELLYPSSASGSIAGVDVDLLMEATKIFPGTIAPKVELSTKTTIEETVCSCNNPTSSTVIVNPKVLMSSQEKRTRKVCHSVEYSKNQTTTKTKKRPPFCYRKADDDLILRKPNDCFADEKCCKKYKNLERKLSSKESCRCRHEESLCPLCAKYSGLFETHSKSRTDLFSEKSCFCCQPMATYRKQDSCLCVSPKRSLAEKLHTKLTKTLSSIPKLELPCYCSEEECDCATSRGELYRDLQRFYGDLYQRAKSISCVSTCPRI